MRAARIVVGALVLALLGQATALATTRHPPPKRAPAPAAPAATNYVVRPGDNLETIAKRFNTTVAALASTNKVRNKNVIVIGTRLKLPAASFDFWAAHYGVPPDLLKALAWYESGWQNSVVSKTGAVGVGQLMPFTSDFVADTLLKNPALDPAKADDNIRMSARFLRFLLDHTGGAAGLALAAYYQGLARTQQGKFFEETKRYVAGVSSTRLQFRRPQ